MAGNQARERAFQIPLLFELAMWDDPPVSGRGRKSFDLEVVRENVLRRFPFTSDQRKKTRLRAKGKPYNILDNEVDFAFDELERDNEVIRSNRRWEITEKGLVRLHSHIHRLLDRVATEDDWQLLLSSTGSTGHEQLLCLMQSLDESVLFYVVNAVGTTRELFLAAFKALPTSKLGSVLSFMDREILPIIMRDLTRRNSHEFALL